MTTKESRVEGIVMVWIEIFPPFSHENTTQGDADESNFSSSCIQLPCLQIPKTHITNFCRKPYKWIRFITGAVAGAAGMLKWKDGEEVDYNAELTPGDTDIYFFIDSAERARAFSVDPDLANAYVTSGATSTRRAEFEDELRERDGATCVVTRMPAELCEASHLISHNKGDEYIDVLTRNCGRDPDNADHIDDIDDCRNGLYLYMSLHRQRGSRDIGFLVTPNLAMSSNDMNPEWDADQPQWVFHDFRGTLDPSPEFSIPAYGMTHPHNQPIRIPEGRNDWPPRVLFDAVYASVIMKYFSHKEFVDFVNAHWKDRYNQREVTATCSNGGKAKRDAKRREKKATKIREK
ncbi:uncharacterized protein LAESUDRAFT_750971 [Laetiporus sulphureus 93-53]|uniref:HNH nuclease domain-containing protein n=1 Tax=Laetiporus sulphureus 93-53 TaxID=1314785 RepID=A0A165DGD7_9APHY|nr:uncharacterized protein LAESUDRAFT_750971 [Laetiporus sulphureus 93-53]KZT04831.1 hypothetical protein LAESUDRAFT_750971 [Laetiporus sulphureus 93-53]